MANELIVGDRVDGSLVSREGEIAPLMTAPTQRYIISLNSPASRSTMAYILNSFAREIGFVHHSDIDWRRVDDVLISGTLNKMMARGISPSRLNGYLTAIKQSARRAWGMELISERQLFLISDIKGIKGRRIKRRRTLTAKETTDIFFKRHATSWKAIRDNAIVALALGCGLRRAEVIGLGVADIQPPDPMTGRVRIKVLGKGNKERLVAVSQSTMHYLEKWLDVRSTNAIDCARLFTRFYRSRISNTPIQSPEVVYQILQERCELAGMDRRISPHDLRHSMATTLYKAGVKIELIQDILGHTNIDTTKRYIEVEQHVYDDAMDNVVLPS